MGSTLVLSISLFADAATFRCFLSTTVFSCDTESLVRRVVGDPDNILGTCSCPA